MKLTPIIGFLVAIVGQTGQMKGVSKGVILLPD